MALRESDWLASQAAMSEAPKIAAPKLAATPQATTGKRRLTKFQVRDAAYRRVYDAIGVVLAELEAEGLIHGSSDVNKARHRASNDVGNAAMRASRTTPIR